MTTTTPTITLINTPSYKRTAGTCKLCFVHRVTLTHNYKGGNGKRIKICTRCADKHTN